MTQIKKKVMTVVGARPQFIKCAALSNQLRKYFHEIIVHTGQHYDFELSQQFFTELKIAEPNYNLHCGNESGVKQIADIMLKLDEIVAIEKPDCIIVFGDTNSTAAAAIVAAKANIKLAHIEAGMREFDKTIPEESNKLITSILCDYNFCPTATAVGWLKDMGITKNVFNVGDVMIDIIALLKLQINNNEAVLSRFHLQKKKYVLMTCHRAANTDNKHNLTEILKAAAAITLPVIFTLHPRTKKAIEQYNLSHYLNNNNMIICEPLGYIDTQTLIKNAQFVLTDSGGITKEAYYHKVQGILIDKQTEWVETLHTGWNIQAGPSFKKITEAIKKLKKPLKHQSVLGNGHAAEKTAKILHKLLTGL
jgi:UDP-N-acetylglucosamine 2-epimerase